MGNDVLDGIARILECRRDHQALAALEAIFVAHIDFVAKHPGVPRVIFGELQRAEDTLAKRAVQTLLAQYSLRLVALMEQGKARGELAPTVDPAVAAPVFIGIIQGLVMQSLLAGNVERIRHDAPRVFAIYQRGIRSAQ